MPRHVANVPRARQAIFFCKQQQFGLEDCTVTAPASSCPQSITRAEQVLDELFQSVCFELIKLQSRALMRESIHAPHPSDAMCPAFACIPLPACIQVRSVSRRGMRACGLSVFMNLINQFSDHTRHGIGGRQGYHQHVSPVCMCGPGDLVHIPGSVLAVWSRLHLQRLCLCHLLGCTTTELVEPCIL